MPVNYAQHVQTKVTPQSEAMPGMVENSSAGFAFPVDDWTRLDRFLILGAEGGSFYATERKLTRENAACVERCLAADRIRTIDRIVSISESGRAPKNDPAIFALALAAASKSDGKGLVELALPIVCRTGTHLFQFAEAVQSLRGWGRSLRRAIADWYAKKDAQTLAYQVSKYQSRNGWSHRDLLRLSHPKVSGARQTILHWVAKGWDGVGAEPHDDANVLPIWAFEKAKRATTHEEIVALIRTYNLPRECVPTQWLTDLHVWAALLERMPLYAMVRNLATMTRIGLLAPMTPEVGDVIGKLGREAIHKSRLHPIAILSAMRTYASGRSVKGSNNWTPVTQIVDALDGAFYDAFANVEPTGKRWLLALDVSGSMAQGEVAGVPGLSPRDASAALALVTANTETNWMTLGFTAGTHRTQHAGYPAGLTPLAISPRQRLIDAIRAVAGLQFGGTDCALPMLHALQHKIPVDAFVVYTDSETWAGDVHPVQALRQYRQKMGIGAKLIVCGLVSNGFTIADPEDGGMMDCVGFDTAMPQIMSDFARA